MADNATQGTAQVIPYLYYADVPKAIDFLVRAFGFEKVMLEPTGNGRHHGEVRLGQSVVMMGTAAAEFGSIAPGKANPRTSGTFVYLGEVDDHCARAKAAGAEIVRDLKDQPYGRTYWARDLEGQDWFFTKPPG
jgi:uncharacterized glyoxalase superfamily protein PhnB